ncbi:hypothetical protein C7212DRAFT_195922, partial [Tuber magnatum]
VCTHAPVAPSLVMHRIVPGQPRSRQDKPSTDTMRRCTSKNGLIVPSPDARMPAKTGSKGLIIWLLT